MRTHMDAVCHTPAQVKNLYTSPGHKEPEKEAVLESFQVAKYSTVTCMTADANGCDGRNSCSS